MAEDQVPAIPAPEPAIPAPEPAAAPAAPPPAAPAPAPAPAAEAALTHPSALAPVPAAPAHQQPPHQRFFISRDSPSFRISVPGANREANAVNGGSGSGSGAGTGNIALLRSAIRDARARVDAANARAVAALGAAPAPQNPEARARSAAGGLLAQVVNGNSNPIGEEWPVMYINDTMLFGSNNASYQSVNDFRQASLVHDHRYSTTSSVSCASKRPLIASTIGFKDPETIEEKKQKAELGSLIRELDAKRLKVDPELETILFSKKLSDVVLRFPDSQETIPAHKLMLAKGSPTFEAMFETDMVEKIKGEVLIQEVSPQVMRLVLRYLYNAKPLEQLELQSNAIELYKAAHLYQIEGLKGLTEKALIVNAQSAPNSEAQNLIATADLYNLTDLRKRMLVTVKNRLIAELKEPEVEKYLLDIEAFIIQKKLEEEPIVVGP